MKDLFEYFRKRESQGKPILNAEGKKFFGEVHMIFNDGKPVHTRMCIQRSGTCNLT